MPETSDPPAQKAKPAEPQAAPVKPRSRLWLIAVPFILTVLVGSAVIYVLQTTSPEETHLILMGNIDVRQVNLAFKVDGRIELLTVDEGDTVQQGQVIATLDQKYFRDDLNVARAHRDNLAASLAKLEHGSRPEEKEQAAAQTRDREAALKLAEENFDRAKQLVEKGGVSRQEFDRTQSAVESAQAQLQSARDAQRLVDLGPRQEDIDMARALLAEQDGAIVQRERRLADAELVAPSSGTILTRARERGAIVQAGETVFTLTLTSPVWVRTYLNERDLGLDLSNADALVTTDSNPGEPYHARVGFISPTAEFTPKAVETRELRTDLVYRMRVVVDNPDGRLRQGMPVTVTIQRPKPRPRTFWERVQLAFNLNGHSRLTNE